MNGNLVYTGNSWPNPWRIGNAFAPVYGNSIKFADAGSDLPTHSGFYYDEMSYSIIPEPGTGLLVLTGLLGLAGSRRGCV